MSCKATQPSTSSLYISTIVYHAALSPDETDVFNENAEKLASREYGTHWSFCVCSTQHVCAHEVSSSRRWLIGARPTREHTSPRHCWDVFKLLRTPVAFISQRERAQRQQHTSVLPACFSPVSSMGKLSSILTATIHTFQG